MSDSIDFEEFMELLDEKSDLSEEMREKARESGRKFAHLPD